MHGSEIFFRHKTFKSVPMRTILIRNTLIKSSMKSKGLDWRIGSVRNGAQTRRLFYFLFILLMILQTYISYVYLNTINIFVYLNVSIFDIWQLWFNDVSLLCPNHVHSDLNYQCVQLNYFIRNCTSRTVPITLQCRHMRVMACRHRNIIALWVQYRVIFYYHIAIICTNNSIPGLKWGTLATFNEIMLIESMKSTPM